MSRQAAGIRLLVRRPLTIIDRQCLAVLVLTAAWCGLFALFPGARGGPLPIFFASLLITAGLVALGVRWAPILGALLCALLLISMFTLTGYVTYHLTQPQAAFPLFVIVLLFLASALATLVLATLALAAYAGAVRTLAGQTTTPRWLTPAFTALLGVVAGAILIGAIARPATGAATTAGGAPVVHLGAASFAPALIAVPRGSKLVITDDAAVLHILTNGSWQHGQAIQALEPEAPHVANVHVDGGTVTIGPFTQPGTFNIMCIVHPGMDLTVVVP